MRQQTRGRRTTVDRAGTAAVMLLAIAALTLADAVLRAETAVEPATSSRLVTLSGESGGLVEVLAVNRRGTLLGRRESSRDGVLEMRPFFRIGAVDHGFSIPAPFTNVEAMGLSDTDRIVGYALRAPGDHDGSQRAVVWTGDNSELLPIPDGYRDGSGHAISVDGTRVSGILLGRSPARIVPCLWIQMDSGWSCQVLPTPAVLNRLLTSAQVMLSPDGRVVAGSVVRSSAGEDATRNQLCFWRERDAWQGRIAEDRGVHLAAVNDSGVAVGRVSELGRRRAFVYHPQKGGIVLPLPDGCVASFATSVNESGEVVGVAEELPGPDSKTFAFAWTDGAVKLLVSPTPNTRLVTANWITNEGRIAGMLESHDGSVHGYVLD